MVLYFITGNENKYQEIKSIISEIEMKEMDLVEIQENNPQKIIEHKLLEASRLNPELELIVEDTSLYLDCLNGYPGPNIKWFMEKNPIEKIYDIANKQMNMGAQAKTIIGYIDSNKNIKYFEGYLKGEIVKPKVESNFGWDPIFRAEDQLVSFGEMRKEAKNKISMRGQAARKLKEFLELHK